MGRYRDSWLVAKAMRPSCPELSGTGPGGRRARALMALLVAAAIVWPTRGLLHALPADGATLTEHLNALGVILPRERAAAPDFALDGPDGHALSLKGLRGQVVFLNFWATWCLPCRQEMPAMERLHQAYRNRGLAVVAVNSKESEYEVRAFLEELHLTFPVVLDRTGAVTASFAVRGLPAVALAGYLALYLAALCTLPSRRRPRPGSLHVVAAASLWVALEFLRTYLLSGFPWNLLAYSQHESLALIQVAAVTGVYGVSFVVVAVNAALARVIQVRGHWTQAAAPGGTAALCWALAVGAGWLQALTPDPNDPIQVALVQDNIEQGVKWNPTWQQKTPDIYRHLTLEAARKRPRLIVWPETAEPFFLRADPRQSEIAALAPEAGTYLLIGPPDRDAGYRRNAVLLLEPDGRILGRYDKQHLVPFGEYVPLKRLLFFANVLAGGTIGAFTPGSEATVFFTPFGRFGVVICYEAIFPGGVRTFFLHGADFVINITNDAWFGRTAAPVKHPAMAAFRAVENRAYLIRAANTGISAIVAPDGRVEDASGLFTSAIVSGAIRLRPATSLYGRYGDTFAWGTVGAALVTACFGGSAASGRVPRS